MNRKQNFIINSQLSNLSLTDISVRICINSHEQLIQLLLIETLTEDFTERLNEFIQVKRTTTILVSCQERCT